MTDITRAGYFGFTTTKTATTDPDNFVVIGAPESRHAFLVQSDSIIHVTRTPSGETVVDATTANGLRIPANSPVLINAFAGDALSFVLGGTIADPQTASGTIWFTETDR